MERCKHHPGSAFRCVKCLEEQSAPAIVAECPTCMDSLDEQRVCHTCQKQVLSTYDAATIVAECWTCRLNLRGITGGINFSRYNIEQHRAAGHDVREVKR